MSEQEQDNYTAKNVSLSTIATMDSDDKELAAYKAKLLGGAVAEDGKVVAAFPNDPRKVIVESIDIVLFDDDLPEDKRVLKLDVTKEDQKIVIKEGSIFQVYVSFFVQHEIALGLKFTNTLSRLGLKNDDKSVLGSFAPALTAHRVRASEHEAPSGMLGRGNYSGTAHLYDDDGSHCNFKYNVEIGKKWEH